MRRLLPLSLAALAVLGAPVVLAEDAPTYTFPSKVTWKAGDVATRTETEKQVQKVKVTLGEQVVQQGETVVESAFEAVLAVKEVDEAGEYTKAVVYFKSWKRSVGTDADDSLTGMRAEVTGAGSKRTVKVVTPDAKVSPDAAAWLQGKFGAGEDKPDDLFVPAKPVAVGETWSLDLAKVRETFGKGGFAFVEGQGSAKGTLTGVEARVGTTTFEIDLPARSLTTQHGTIEYAEPVVFAVRATLRNALDASTHDKGGETNVRFAGKGLSGGAAVVELDVDVTTAQSLKDGGQVPELPPAGK